MSTKGGGYHHTVVALPVSVLYQKWESNGVVDQCGGIRQADLGAAYPD